VHRHRIACRDHVLDRVAQLGEGCAQQYTGHRSPPDRVANPAGWRR
jgi:hypothetical protein